MMTPYEIRDQLKKEVPEVGIFPILTNELYSEEEYQEVLKNQLKLKKDIETGNMKKMPIYTWEQKELRMEEFYEKGWFMVELPKSMFGGES